MTTQIKNFIYHKAKKTRLGVETYKNIWPFNSKRLNPEAIKCVKASKKKQRFAHGRICSHVGVNRT
ncbi:hypothetical protein HYALB_00001656 [Hymenoscyphus albidus]|uniref:Uncharacterized protein n=1 Tax=Hymenoscyphus albidus TaxID=595503 RepID=A0A9N9LEG4_9HELO|nr:hypothetical protein HYALB_00001656 [Hymenoscyphus albidus]